MPVALNVDGLERKRKKWNAAARAGIWAPNGWRRSARRGWLLTRSGLPAITRSAGGKRTTFIPYGAETGAVKGTETLRRLGLEPGRYFVYVSRLEPENNALLVRESFEKVDTDLRLALIGDAPYSHEYIKQVAIPRTRES
jgi:glycosyltransferase involved in cell wall biosynthesis